MGFDIGGGFSTPNGLFYNFYANRTTARHLL
jgi:hypothetical protein